MPRTRRVAGGDDLTDEEWAAIEQHPPKKGRGPVRRDDWVILNGIFYILRTGAPWRDLPERYEPRTTVYNRYVRWGERGIWKGYLMPWHKNARCACLH